MLEKNLSIEKETILNVNGRNVKFIEFESAREGDFVKVCTQDHNLGVAAEYAWVKNKYYNAIRTKQEFTTIKLNEIEIKCDILSIKTKNTKIKQIYFDISQMMENLHNMGTGKTNKELWEDKAKIIYEKLIQELNFSVVKDDEESLFKEINENITIGFDISYFFGFIIKGNKIDERLRKEYLNILDKYISIDFIGDITLGNGLIGGHIKIGNLDDINIVFEKYKEFEEEIRGIK
jgi:hypothetical protein